MASIFVESSSFTNNISWQILFKANPWLWLVEQMVLFDDDTITAVLLWLDSRRCLYIATNVATLVQLKAYNLIQSILSRVLFTFMLHGVSTLEKIKQNN